MRNSSRFRPSPALVISLIALFVSISGVAWAAATIGTSDIKNSAVTAKKLHKNAVTTNKIKNNAVNGAKVADNAVNGAKVADGSLGSADLGPVVTRTASITVPAGSARIVSKSCDPGELALSAGANWNGAATVGPVLQAATYLTGTGGTDPTGGSAVGRNEGGGPRTLTVSVNCLAP
jgi:hypothetical protein